MVAAAKLLEPLAEMDRGPPRVFHQRGARARPVLGAGDRGRRARRKVLGIRGKLLHDTGAYTRAGPEHPVQFGVDHERALRDPGARDRRHHRHDQQDAGVVGARRRLSAGVVRDGAAARSGGARDEARPRRGAAAQSHPAREDAVPEADQGALRRDHRNTTAATIRPARPRRSRPPAGTISAKRQDAGAQAGPLSRHRARRTA